MSAESGQTISAAKMRALEAVAMTDGSVTGQELMERAGQGVVEAILEAWPETRVAPQSASVLCGPGNNGGDGFVVARLLRQRGWQVAVFAVETKTPDARANRAAWEALGPVKALNEPQFRAQPPAYLVVDAIFGIGLSRPVKGEIGDLLRHLAGRGGDAYHDRLLAIDIPSGLNADTGAVFGPCPQCRATVTFHRAKPGHFIGQGPAVCGQLFVKDIGL